MDNTIKRGLVGFTGKISDKDYDRSIGYCKSDSRSYPQLQEYLYTNQEKETQNPVKAPSEQLFLETQLIWQQDFRSQFLCFQQYDVLHLEVSKRSGRVGDIFRHNSPLLLQETHNSTLGTYNMIKISKICNQGMEIEKSIGTTNKNKQQGRCYQ